MYSSNMYKGTGVHGITIKRLSALELIVFGLSNAFKNLTKLFWLHKEISLFS